MQERLKTMTTEQLVNRFVEIGIAQDEAELLDDTKRFNRLYDEKRKILDELRSRPDEQRQALVELYGHANMQVRLNAVHATLAINPGAARQMLEEIANSNHFPHLRGRVVAGQDDMGGSSANRLTGQSGGVNGDTLGDTGGEETHALTTSEMPSHTHDTSLKTSGSFSASNSIAWGASNVVGGSITSSSAGSDAAHNNVQPTIILNYIIKT